MHGAKEFTGRSLDEAIEAACKFYDLPREKLEVEIINDAKSGIFGLVGAKKATVRAKQISVENIARNYSPEKDEAEEGPALAANTKKQDYSQSGPGRQRSSGRRPAEDTPQQPTVSLQEANEPGQREPGQMESAEPETSKFPRQGRSRSRFNKSRELRSADGQRETRQPRRPRRENPDAPESDQRRERRGQSGETSSDNRHNNQRDFDSARQSSGQRHRNFPAKDTAASDLLEATDFEDDLISSSGTLQSFEKLDKEHVGALSHETLEKLLAPICPEAELGVNVEEDRVTARIDCGEASGLIIGREGQTLAALQYMASRIVSRKLEAAVHIHLDTGDYKERQDGKLRDLALRLAEKARETGRTQSTRPLSSYHRRIIHMTLQECEDLETRSRGEGSMKRVYVYAK